LPAQLNFSKKRSRANLTRVTFWIKLSQLRWPTYFTPIIYNESGDDPYFISASSFSMSSSILKTYLAGQSATAPDNATETAVASNIS
jgi:hypothetical protein